MVLRPIFDFVPASVPDFVTAWSAIEAQQTAKAGAWQLISQSDHAALSGEIARQFSGDGFPRADEQIARAIAMHDAGWELFESDPQKPPCIHADGRPVSFFEVEPRTFLRAWTASVDRAEADSAVGGYLVSKHFCWLGEYRLDCIPDPPDERDQIDAFLARERCRQQVLARSATDASRWDALLPLLQFCDLFSLYLCSGARQPVEFPQEFTAGHIRVRFENDICVLSPTPLAEEMKVEVRAWRYPAASDEAGLILIPFSIK